MTERMQEYRNRMKENEFGLKNGMRSLSNTLQNFAGKSEKKRGKNGMTEGQVSSKLILRRLLLSQKTFQNQIICMTITSALLVGRGVIEASRLYDA